MVACTAHCRERVAVIWIIAFTLPLLISVAIALLSAVGTGTARRLRQQCTRFAWVSVVPAGVAAIADSGERHEVDWLLLGTTLQIDNIALPLVLLAVVLYGLALAFTIRAKTDRPHILTAFLLACFIANVGVFAAADLVTFYLSFAAMSFLGYAIVVHSRTEAARRAGAIYIVLTVFGETAVLSALLLIASGGVDLLADAPAAVAASPHSGLIIVLLLIGFGVKAGTVPLHVWLPLAHPAAPTPASAVLSGVMLKAGVAGWLRLLPLGEGSGEPVWGAVLIMLALVGGLLAVPLGLLHSDPKVILAYSSISQMGFIAAILGAALLAPELAPACIAAAVLYSVHHGLVKSSLFLSVQAWDSERMPRWVVCVGVIAAGLALVGVPLSSGYFAKYSAKNAIESVVVPGSSALEIADVLTWFGLGSTLLLARFVTVLLARDRRPHPTARTRDAALLLVALTPILPVVILAQQMSPPLEPPEWFALSTWWTQMWPLLLGLLLSIAAARITSRPGLQAVRLAHPQGDIVPAGDLIVVEERASLALTRQLGRASRRLGELVHGAARAAQQRAPSGRTFSRAGRWIGRWTVSGILLMTIVAALLIVAVGLYGGGSR